jgi:hypothetical protein
MKLSIVTFRAVIATFVLVSLSIYGCGSSSGKTDTSTVTDQNTSSGGAISYSKDIQTIFNPNCAMSSCHGTNPPSGLKLTSYADITKGGVSGKPYVAGDSANSLIIKRLEGTIPPRMPSGGAALSSDQIKKIKDWINAGAKDN